MSSNHSNVTDDMERLLPSIPIRLTIYISLMLCSFVGNVALIIVITTNRVLRNSFNNVVVNMAISDLVVPIAIIPNKIFTSLPPKEFPIDGTPGVVFCKIYFFLADLSHAVSAFSLVLIAINRFVVIVFPFKVGLSNMMEKKNKYCIGLVWILAIAMFIPHFNTVGITENQKCEVDKDEGIIQHKIIVVGIFFIPFTIIIILYFIMLTKLFRNSEHVASSLNEEQNRSRKRRNRKIFFLSVAIILSCLLLVGPLYSFLLVQVFIWEWDNSIIGRHNVLLVFFILHIMYYIYTCINPLIYFVFIKSYRQGLKRLFYGHCGHRGRDLISGSKKQETLLTSNYRQSTRVSKPSITSNERIEMKESISKIKQ